MCPVGAIYKESADDALDVFNNLTLVDAPNGPEMLGTLCRTWVTEIVRALFGAFDPEAKRRRISQFFLCVSKKNGKALALDTPIPTPSGWTTIGEVRPGDFVFGASGKPVKVIAESDVFFGHDCYKVEFSNGESVIADAGHFWMTKSLADKGYTKRTTEEIFRTVSTRSDGAKNHSIIMPFPVDLPDSLLPIAPYTLGAWLGDGHTSTGKITTMDQEILDSINKEGYRTEYRSNNGSKASTYSIHPDNGEFCQRGHSLIEERKNLQPGKPPKCKVCERAHDHFHRNGTELPPIVPRSFHEILRETGLLGNKHIPSAYLRGSLAQRVALLQGLMDTDGTASKNGGNISFTTKLKSLSDGVSELLATFGIKHSVTLRPSSINGEIKGYYYTVLFFAFRDEIEVFRLHRKLDRQRISSGNKNLPRSKTVQIVSVEKVDSVPTKCICVDSPDHLFLFGKTMIPTHNSSIAAGVMLTALVVNHRPSAEFLILAPTKEGAENAYKPIRDMINADEELKSRFQIQEHTKTITDRLNQSTLKIVAADSATVTGKKATGVFIDELHEFGKSHKAMHMLTEATGGLASRPEGFVVYCTTQSSDPPAGVFSDKLAYARKVRDGVIKDNRFLPIIFEFPPEWIRQKKHLDLSNAWVTNPNWGLSVDEEVIRQKYQEASEAGEHAIRDFMAKHCNVQVSAALSGDRWAGADYWDACRDTAPVTLDRILEECEVVEIGIDGGGLDDLLGLSVVGRVKGGTKWLHWAHAWAHDSVLQRHKHIAPRLHDFKKEGSLTIVERIGQDVEAVAMICARVYESGLLDKIGVDPHGLGGILEAIEAEGVPEDKILGISQGWKLTGAIKTTERKLAEGQIAHGGQALMSWCVSNAKVEPRGNAVIITKQGSGAAKIDALLATFNAVSLLALNPDAATSSYQMYVFG